MFKHKLSNIGYWMIMLAGVSMIAGNWFDFDDNLPLSLINGIVAIIGLVLMFWGMKKASDLEKKV